MTEFFEPQAAIVERDIGNLRMIARAINNLHKDALSMQTQAFEKMRDIGQRLLQCKEILKRVNGDQKGTWLSWLEQHTDFSRATACRYMRIARDWSTISNLPVISDAAPWLVQEATEDGDPLLPAETSAATATATPGATSAPSETAPEIPPETAPESTAQVAQTAAPPVPGPELLMDAAGIPLPPRVIPAFQLRPAFNRVTRTLDEVKAALEEVKQSPAGSHLHAPGVEYHLGNLRSMIHAARPAYVCPYCLGVEPPCDPTCACKGSGWVPQRTWEQSPAGHAARAARTAPEQENLV